MIEFVLILFLLSPIPLYWFVPLIDILSEPRAYALVLPISLLFAAYAPYPLVWIALFACLAARRAACFSSPIAYWESAIRDQGEDQRSLLNLGAMYQNAGKMDKAREIHAKIVEKYPDFGLAWLNLGLVDEVVAEAEYMKALQAYQQLGPEDERTKKHADQFTGLMWRAIMKVHLAKHLNPEDPATNQFHQHVLNVAERLKVLH